MTRDQLYGVMLGLLGFAVAPSFLLPVGSTLLTGLVVVAAGLAGLAVSVLDRGRRDWFARLAWAIGAVLLGGLILIDQSGGGAACVALAIMAGSSLWVLRALRASRLVSRLVSAAAAAAPTALMLMYAFQWQPRTQMIPQVLLALSLIAFGLSRVARRPRAPRSVARET